MENKARYRNPYTTLLLMATVSFILSSCSIDASILEGEIRLSSISGKLVGYTSAANSSVHSSENGTCSGPTARLYKLSASGELIQPPQDMTSVSATGEYHFSTENSGLSNFSGSTMVVEIRGCDSSIFYRPVTGFANQDVNMASSLIGYLVNSDKKGALYDALISKPQSVTTLMTLLSAATTVEKAYDILVSSSEASQQFAEIFGVPPEVLLIAAPVLIDSTVPQGTQEKTSTKMKVKATHWSSNYDIIYQWKLGSTVIGTGNEFDYFPSGDSQGEHTLTLSIGKNDGTGAIDFAKPLKTVTSELSITNNILPTPPDFQITLPVSSGLPINTRAITVALATGPSLANCDSFKSLLLNENDSAPESSVDFPIQCSQNNSQSLNYNITSAGDGLKHLYLWAKDSSGVVSQIPTTVSVVLDTALPTVTILTTPLAQSRMSNQSFSFTGGDGAGTVDHFECKMNSGAWTACSSPVSYTGLSEGVQNFSVRAIDTAGNISVPDTKSWLIDLTPPVLTLAGPNAITNSLSATFNLSGTDAGGSGLAGFLCSIDGGAFAGCSAIATYVLSAGSHNFKARVLDGAGNVSAIQTHSWVIDTTPPTVTLTSRPALMTNSLSASFGFVGSDSGGGNVSGFECALDAGAFSSCATGKSYSSLSDGSHTFKVRATDTAGNIGLVTTYTWTIDTTTPMASLSAYPDSITNQTVASFGFSATPPSGGSIIGYECQFDSGAWSSCSSPKSYSSLLQGNHSFGVRSIDNNLNVSDPMTYSWTIDTTMPVLTISGHPAVLTNSASAQFIFAATDAGGGAIDTYYCQLDGAGFNQCSSPRDLSGLAQGSHVFEVKVTDTAGNTSATQSYAWSVDLAPPTITLLSSPALLTNETSAAFTFSATDTGGGTIGDIFCSLDGAVTASCTSGISYTSLVGGVHTFEIYSVDSAGNASTTASFTWTIDVIAPVVTLTSAPLANWNSAGASFNFIASDSGGGSIAGYQCQLDGGAWSACSSGKTYSSLTDGTHSFSVFATDTAGNQSTTVSSTWKVDTVAPVVSITTPVAGSTVIPVGSLSSYSIGGACSENSSSVNIAGLVVTPTSCSAGAWSTNLNLSSLTDASYSISASQTDAAGNAGASATKILVKDATPPVISLTTPVATRGGSPLSISWIVTESNVASGSSFTVEIFDGTSWASFGTLAAVAGVNTSKTYSLSSVNAPSWNTSVARVRVTLMDAAGNQTSVTSGAFVIDSTAPTLASFVLNDGLQTTANNNVRVGFNATDALSNIAKICMQTSDSVPSSASSCWVTVGSYGLTAAKTISTSNIYFNVGLVSGTFPVYIWLMDAVGNVSANTESLGIDKGSVVYNSPTPPVINAIQLTSTDSPGLPPAGTDLSAAAGTSVYIKWNIASVSGLSSAPIQILYTIDDSTEAGTLASGLLNTTNGSCSVTAEFTGCAVVSAPVGTYFRLKLKVTDALGFSTSIVSNPLNSGAVNFLAGRTDLALGASAKSTVLQPSGNYSLAVLDDGRIFLVDSRGLAWVNPATGVYEIIATSAASSSGDGGPLTSAKFALLSGLYVDNNNDILVTDAKTIRKINTHVSPMTISRYLGGGSNSGDYVTGATNFQATSNISHLSLSSNGDVFFKSSNDRKIRKYSPSTGVVSTINLSGTGNYYSSSQDNTACNSLDYFVAFDAVGNVDRMAWYLQLGSSAACPFSTGTNEGRAFAQIDPITGVSFSPNPRWVKSGNGSRDYAYFTNDKSGNVYAANTGSGAVQAIYKFNTATLTWSLAYGSNSPGTCSDGTLKSSCAITAQALSFNSQGQLFYVDAKSKAIRTVDGEGKIRTLVGDRLGSEDGRQVLATRFNSLTDVKSWNANGQSYITVFDFTDVRIREFTPGADIYTVAGAQYSTNAAAGSVAATSSFSNTSDSFPNRIQVSAAGDVYLPRGGGNFARIVRTTGLWEDLWSGFNYGPASVALSPQGMLVNTNDWSLANGSNNSRHYVYNLVAKTLAKIIYIGAIEAPSTVCADGTLLSACLTTGLAKDNGYQGAYDTVTDTWLLPEVNAKRIGQAAANGSGTMSTFFTAPRSFSRFDINRNSDLSVNLVFTCGTDGKLYRYDLNNAGAETNLAFPISTMKCSGGLRYDSFRNSLIFTYTQNGLSGVAEYLAP